MCENDATIVIEETIQATTIVIDDNCTPVTIEIAEVSNDATIEFCSIGEPGLSAYQIAVANGFVGTEEEWLASLVPEFVDSVQHNVKLDEAIAKGQAVYVSGANGTNILVKKASNTTEATSSKTLGLLASSGVLNDFVNVVSEGLLAGLNTSAATIGDPVWLGTNGNLIFGLTNKPYAPAHLVYLGVVTRVHANQGEIFVHVQNGFELREIHDVDLITTIPINGHILGYNGTLWINKTIAEWLGYTPANQSTTISTTAPLQGGGDLSTNRTLSITQASASASGFLSSTDWNTFNNKQNALTNPITGTGTSGQVAFWNGTSSVTGESNLFWDSTNDRLGIGTASPSYNLDLGTTGNLRAVGMTFTLSSANRIINTHSDAGRLVLNGGAVGGSVNNSEIQIGGASNTVGISLITTNSARLSIPSSGNVLIGTTTDAGFRLDVNGTARVQGALTATADSTINGVSIGRGGGNINNNTRVGVSALNANTTGVQNTAIGLEALAFSISSNSNTAVGYMALKAIGFGSISSGNIAIGTDAGRFISDGTTQTLITNNSVFLGVNTRALANNQTNQIVIGHTAVGLGSNTTVLGNSSTTSTAIYGNLLLGQTTDNGTDKLQVTGTVKVSSSVQVGDNAAVASATNVGAIRYRTSGNNSYMDMVMQTGASTYAWVNIKTNTW